MNRARLLLVLLLLGPNAVAQSTKSGAAEIEQLQVKRDGANVRIEVILTGAVKPTVDTAINPDRLVLTLPGTLSDAKQKHFMLNANGVEGVRVGLNSANPPVTRVVVDMDSAHPYSMSADGKSIVLMVQGSETTTASKHSGPVPAASAPITSVFRRRQTPSSTDDTTAQAPIPVPPKLPPINFPPEKPADTQTTASGTPANANPSAAHPKVGSLQQGTVFPGMGTPGAGTVPATQTQTATAQTAAPAPTANQPATTQPLTVTVAQSANGMPDAPTITTATGGNEVPPVTGGVITSQPVVVAAKPTTPVAATTAANNSGITPVPGSTTPSVASTQIAPTAPPPGSTTSSAGSGNITAKVLSATVASPAPATPAVPTAPPATIPAPQAVAATSTPAASTSQGLAPATAVAANGDTQATASVQPSTASTQPAPTPTPEPTELTADITVVPSETEPELPSALALRATHPDFRTTFKVKYVAEGVAYLDGGRSAGLTEGMKLVVRDTPTGSVASAADGNEDNIVAELEVMSVADASAVTDIHTPKRDVKSGDLAYLSSQDEQALVAENTLSATRKYPTVISFTDADALDDEARAEVPRPPMPSVNRARGRIGVDYMGTAFHGASGGTTANVGLVARLDITRIGGTYWNANGYWRGNLNANTYTGTATVQDLINRTYHLGVTYDNPNSALVAGFGRLYLPWAPSLDTIDGGYIGRRIGHVATLGIFAGTTPDPSSWSYNPNQRIAGTFVNFEGGSFDSFRYSSTSGAGLTTIGWNITRPLMFFENGLYYKRYVSIYDSLQLDNPVGYQKGATPGAGVGRNFTTVKFQPHERIEFDANYNYFRDLPTFDPTLIGTGLLDKYLFQGFSGGVRLEVLKQVWLYTSLGRSNRSGDTSNSLNELYGLTFGRIPWINIRADAHYSKFNSSFGSGYYESVSLSRSLKDNFRLELLGGQQNYSSQYSSNSNSKFITSNLEMNVGTHYFLQGGFTVSRGVVQDYDQWMFTLGYRFDTRQRAGAQ